jgi:prevent-host-death family protein
MTEWKLLQAKARLSELQQRARDEGPQVVTLHGEPAAVVLSVAAYERLVQSKPSFVEFLLSGPPWPDDVLDAIDDRQRDAGGREIGSRQGPPAAKGQWPL